MSYDEAVKALEAGKAASGLSCAEVRALLESLGFKVKDGKNGGHKTVTHPGISAADFISAGFNCKGGNGAVDRNYIGTLVRIVKTNRDAIREYLGEDDHEPTK